MPATNSHATALLAYEFNATDPSLPASFYAGLATAYPGRTGTQATSEVAYTPYARQAVPRSALGFTVTGSTVTLTADVSFPKSTAGAAEVAYFATFGDALAGATPLRRIGVLGSALGPFAGEATGDTLTIPGLSGLAVNDQVVAFASPGSTLPGGMTEGTVYYVLTVVGDVVTLSATLGGTILAITSAGDGSIFRCSPITIGVNSEPKLSAGSQVLVVG